MREEGGWVGGGREGEREGSACEIARARDRESARARAREGEREREGENIPVYDREFVCMLRTHKHECTPRRPNPLAGTVVLTN